MLALLMLLSTEANSQNCSYRVVNKNDFGNGPDLFGPPVPPGVTNYVYEDGTPTQQCGTLNYAHRAEDGSYCKVKEPAYALQTCRNGTLTSDWTKAPDHTGDGGYMLVCNASGALDTFYQRTYENLCPGMKCQFSIWVTNICHLINIQPIVRIELMDTVNNILLQSISSGKLPYPTPTTLNWQQLKLEFTVPAGLSSVKVIVRNEQTGNGGNDLALDDVEFSICVPPATLTSVASTGTPEDCQSQIFDINATVDPGAFTDIAYQWQQLMQDGNWQNIVNPNGITSNIFTTPRLPASEGAVTYRCIYAPVDNLDKPNCSGLSDPITVTPRDYRPAQPTITWTAVCEGVDQVLTANSTTAGVTYSWTGGSRPLVIAGNTATITAATVADNGLYQVSATLDNCVSIPGTADVQIKPVPVTPTITWTPVCEGVDQVLTANSTTAGVTYSWAGGSRPLVIAGNTATITAATVADNGIYQVSATLNNCISAPGVADVQIKPMPATPAITWAPVCEGVDQLLTANSTTAGVIYTWTGGSRPLVIAGNTATITAATVADNGLYQVSATLNNCVSIPGTADVQIKPVPVTPTITWTPVCEGVDQMLTANTATTGVTYNWAGGSRPLVIAGNTATITAATVADNGLYQVSATLNNCTSTLGTADVQIKPMPATPTITWVPVCEGVDQVLTANTTTAGVTYNWTGGSRPLVIVDNTATITAATVADNGLYQVSATLNNCISAFGTADVQIKPVPVTPTITWTPVCEGVDQVLTANTATTGVTYNWAGGSRPLLIAGNTATITAATVADNGLYQVSATLNNCTSTLATADVQIKPMPATPTITWVPVCEGVDQVLTANTTTAGVTYNWTGGSRPLVIVDNIATITAALVADNGIYQASVTLNNCISALGTADVQIKPMPVAPTITWTPVCDGMDQVLTANTTTVGVTYNWTGGSRPLVIVDNTATITAATVADNGLYQVSATLNNCTSTLGTADVQIKPVPTTPTITWTPVCEGVDQVLTANTTITGVTYNWVGGSRPLLIAGNTATITAATVADNGTYQASATLNNCVSALGSADVQIKPIPVTPVIAWTPVCEGVDQVLNANTTTAGVTYNWTGGSKPLVIASNTAIITAATVADNGIYQASATLNNCTSTPGSADVQIKPVPVTPAITWTPVCEGVDQVLTANTTTADVTYNWTGGSRPLEIAGNTATITAATVADNGLYQVSATLNNCISAFGTADVQIKPIPVTPTITWTPVCEGVDQVLTANTTTTGVTYNWTGGSKPLVITGNTATITAATIADNGLYHASATLNNCISALGSADVQIKPVPATPAITWTPVCEGADQVLTANTTTTGVTYNWTGGSRPLVIVDNTATITAATVADNGLYQVSATLNNCTSVLSSANVQIKPIPVTPNITWTPVCEGVDQVLTANSTTADVIYNWTGGSRPLVIVDNTATITKATVADNGLYQASATLNNCTSAFGTADLKINPVPVTPTITWVPVCEGVDQVLTANTTTTGVTYNWTGGSKPLVITGNTATITAAAVADNGLYQASATLNNCISSLGSADVQIKPVPAVPVVGSNAPLCESSDLQLTASSTAAGDIEYRWSGPANFSSNEQNPTLKDVSIDAGGLYNIYVVSQGCVSPTASMDVIIHPKPPAPVVNNPLPECAGNNEIHLADHVKSDHPLIWLTADTTLIGSVAPVVPANKAGIFIYYVASYSAQHCRSQALSIQVIINENPNVVVNVKDVSCLNGSDGSVVLEVSGSQPPYSYAWSNGSTNKDLVNVTAGAYTVTVTDNKACSKITDVLVKDGTNPPAPIAQSKELCSSEGTVMLTAQGVNLRWYDEQLQPIASAPYIDKSVPASHTYYVTSTNELQCESEKTIVTALVRPTPIMKIVDKKEPNCYGYEKGYFEVAADSGCNNSVYTYKMSGRAEEQTSGLFTDVSPGTYQVRATDECGCTATQQVEMGINTADCDFHIPSAFTPNGDNLNDIFRPASYGKISNYRMQIFTRAGQLIFESRTPEHGWDGRFKQIEQPPASYVWQISYTDIKGKIKFLKGTVVLLR